MADIQDQITALNEQVTKLVAKRHELNAEMKQAELDASAHEEKARHLRNVVRSQLREQRNALDKEIDAAGLSLRHAEVIARTNESRDSAEKAKSEAEKARSEAEAGKKSADETLARLAEKEKQLDELLAKAAKVEAKTEEKTETEAAKE